jgi:hypothetical protein
MIDNKSSKSAEVHLEDSKGKSDKCYLKMSELSSLNLRRISIPSPTDVVLV